MPEDFLTAKGELSIRMEMHPMFLLGLLIVTKEKTSETVLCLPLTGGSDKSRGFVSANVLFNIILAASNE
jgi:hypothetical protein